MWIHGNYHAITCSVTTMEFQSIYSSLPHTKAQASGPLLWRPEHGTAWHGRVSRRGCHAPPDWLHSWARASLSQFLLPSNYLCQSYIVLRKMSSRGEAWDDCPELSFSRACVTVPCFVNQPLVSAPKLSVTESPLNYILWSTSSVWEKCSPLYFMYLFFEEILNTSIMSSLGIQKPNSACPQKTPCHERAPARRTTHNRLGR